MPAKKDKILKICQKCGKEYYCFPYRAATSKFCSKECYDTTGITKVCKWCEKEFYVPINRKETANYCSVSCASKDRFKDGAWNKGIPNPIAINSLKKTWELNKGNKYREGKEPWNKNTVGLCKPNNTSFAKGHKLGVGRKMTPEHVEKMAASKRGKKMGARPEWVRKKISDSQKGEKSKNWKGGKTDELRLLRMSVEYRLWREAVYKRDNWTCQECGQHGGTLNPHHLMSFAEYPDLRFEINNGVTLCVPCHKKTHNYARNIKKKVA